MRWTFNKGITLTRSRHHGQSRTAMNFRTFFWMHRIAVSCTCKYEKCPPELPKLHHQNNLERPILIWARVKYFALGSRDRYLGPHQTASDTNPIQLLRGMSHQRNNFVRSYPPSSSAWPAGQRRPGRQPEGERWCP